jgi:SNF2 family DNA or RNA helicase
LIADEMGLGKTIQAIAIACNYREEWPALVVCPSSMKYAWASELEKWLPDLEPGSVNMVKTRNDCGRLSRAKMSIVSVGLFVNNSPLVEAVKNQQFQVVILDESHYIKNPKSLRAKLLMPILKAAARTILLSGTPALARPVELYAQVVSLQPKLFGSYTSFTNQYCDAKMGRFRREVNGSSNLEELHEKLGMVIAHYAQIKLTAALTLPSHTPCTLLSLALRL